VHPVRCFSTCVPRSFKFKCIPICLSTRGREYINLVRKSEGKGLRVRSKRRWEDNIRLGLREIAWEGVDRMHPAQNSDHLRALVNT
jgi:hypothetical protein